jgi:hypothetical protein
VIHFYMGFFLYRCPNTIAHVQAWGEEDDDFSDCLYLPIKCAVCLRPHLVNPKSGHVLGTDDDVTSRSGVFTCGSRLNASKH